MQREVIRLIQQMRRTMECYDMAARGDHVVVALSGGADSVATLAALDLIAPRLGLRLSAAHVHHGLRGREADEDAEFAGELAARLKVPFQLLRLPPGLAQGGNTEERARELRYRALSHAARELGATKIATGHTRDDQAETVLLRVVRGSGPRGLVAIQPVAATGEGVPVIRPLLECSRSQLERFLAASALPHREDSSNRSGRFLRNRIRHDVLPLLRQLNPAVDRALADLATLSGERERWLADVLRTDATILAVPSVQARASELHTDVLRQWLERVRGNSRGLTRRHFVALLGLLRPGRPNRRVEVPGGAVVLEYDRLRYVAADRDVSGSASVVLAAGEALELNDWRIEVGPVERYSDSVGLPSDLWSALVDADRTPSSFVVRTSQAGDRVRPCGMMGRRKLSDVFIDRRVPRGLRWSCPVVEVGSEVLWVPGVVRGSVGLVGPETRRVVWLRAQSDCRPLLG